MDFLAELHHYNIETLLSIFQQPVGNDNKLFHHAYDERHLVFERCPNPHRQNRTIQGLLQFP